MQKSTHKSVKKRCNIRKKQRRTLIRYSKQEIIDILPKLDGFRYILYDFETLEISPDTVLAMYRIESEVIKSGEERKSLRSSLWQNRDGKWQMIFHQGTPQGE